MGYLMDLVRRHRAQSFGWQNGLFTADDVPDFIDADIPQPLVAERRLARQQFISQRTEAVDVAAGVDVHPAGSLLRTHVSRGADEIAGTRVGRVELKISRRGLGDAEVDHL